MLIKLASAATAATLIFHPVPTAPKVHSKVSACFKYGFEVGRQLELLRKYPEGRSFVKKNLEAAILLCNLDKNDSDDMEGEIHP